jgi:cob(I)alamin adenosyltransferase
MRPDDGVAGPRQTLSRGCDSRGVAGKGLKVYIIHFMKGWPHYGELRTAAHHPNMTLNQFGRPDCVDKENPALVDVRMAQEALDHGRQMVMSQEHDLVILDEVNVALEWRLIELQDLLSLLDDKPEGVELMLTGRYARSAIIARADLVTEMRDIKHPYQRGILSRKGIDY